MKRFYCTICKRVKRVHSIPASGVSESPNPYQRFGTCNKHYSYKPAKSASTKGGR